MMNGRNGTLSPVSIDSNSNSEWSPVTKYQGLNGSENYSPTVPPNGRPPVITPPHSLHTSASIMDGPLPNGRGPMSNGNPSPPSSVGRSSVGTALYDRDGMSDRGEVLSGRKAVVLEESLAEHYQVLKRYLAPYLRDEKGGRPNRARDKLLRLSPVQFQELSTDVYDESMRREDERRRGGPNAPGNNVPKSLPPKGNFHPKRNQARQKLSTLPIERFRQLATDVFYELERRFPRFTVEVIDRAGSPALSTTSNRSRGPGRGGPPPPGMNGPPPGFRGRGGPPPGRGGPPFRNGPPGSPGLPPPQNELGRPLPKTFQQNTIVPNKSTLVEDDDDQSALEDDDDDQDAFDLEGAAQRQSKRTTNKSLRSIGHSDKQVSQLQEELVALQEQLKEKDATLVKLQESEKEKEEQSELKASLERKLEEAQDLNENMQNEIEKLRFENSNIERDLRSQIDEVRENGSALEWQQRYSDLEKQLEEQQSVTDDVRRAATESLQEMRELSAKSEQAFEREEKMMRQVSQLEAEIKEWKGRYTRMKTQLRSSRGSSMGLSVNSDKSFNRDPSFTHPHGMVKDFLVTRFQLSIDELLQLARRTDLEAVLNGMKTVVVSVRNITAAVETKNGGDINQLKQLTKLKSRVSATANNLITASKNHASSSGLAPVSLLDAAASHLATAVIELVRVAKIRPTPPEELDDEGAVEDKPRPISKGFTGMSNGYGHVRNSRGSSDSIGLSGYSATSSPRQTGGSWAARRSDALGGPLESIIADDDYRGNGLSEFKSYLDNQTGTLVSNIQPLVQSIRAKPSSIPLSVEESDAIIDYVNEISRIMHETAAKTREAIETLGDLALARHAPPVIKVLEECRNSLIDAEGQRDKIPPPAFKTARAMKELLLRVERIENGELTADQEPEDF